MARKTSGAERATAGRPKRSKAQKPQRVKAELRPRQKRFRELTDLKREAMPVMRSCCGTTVDQSSHVHGCVNESPQSKANRAHWGQPSESLVIEAPKRQRWTAPLEPAQLALPLDDEPAPLPAVVSAPLPVVMPEVLQPVAQQVVNIQVNASGLLAAAGGRPFNLVIG